MRILVAIEPGDAGQRGSMLKLTWRVDKPGKFEVPVLSVPHLDPKYVGIPMIVTEDEVQYVEQTLESIEYYRELMESQL